ncbi:MAG TPA: non-ribosomal peptide synthetase, partial [Micromonosporaceae bacterium]
PATLGTADLIRRHAAARPDALAIVDDQGEVRYRDLIGWLDQVMAALDQAVPGTVLWLPARRDREYVVRLLACWATGTTAALIDDSWPTARKAAAARVAGVTHKFAADGSVVVVSGDAQAGAVSADAPTGAGLSHLLFTSGTTGDPLAVGVAPGTVEAAVDDLADLLGVGLDDRVAMLSGPAHDPVLRDLTLALRQGGTLCLGGPRIADPGRIGAWLRERRVSVVNLTAPLAGLVFGLDRQPVPTLRLVICGGAPLAATTAASIRAAAPDAVLVNGYGCTETPQLVCAKVIHPDDPLPPGGTLPIGAPLPGRRVAVHDDQGRACPIGVLGQLSVAHPHVCVGYLDQGTTRGATTHRLGPTSPPARPDHPPLADTAGPGARAEDRFFVDADGVRWFRTGDLARFSGDGQLYLSGRADRQSSLNGLRFSPDEVEAVVRSVDGVTDARCDLLPGAHADGLRVWVTSPTGVAQTEVRQRMAAMLPPALAAAQILIADTQPLTHNLKPAPPVPAPAPLPEQPRGEQTARIRLRALIEQAARRPVADQDNFFDAGLDSFGLLQLGAELTEALGRPVPALDLFRYPNLGALAERLFSTPADGPDPGAVTAAGAVGTAATNQPESGPAGHPLQRRLERLRRERDRVTNRFAAS